MKGARAVQNWVDGRARASTRPLDDPNPTERASGRGLGGSSRCVSTCLPAHRLALAAAARLAFAAASRAASSSAALRAASAAATAASASAISRCS